MPNSNIDATINDVPQDAVITAMDTIEDKLDFLVYLTQQERQIRSEMGNATQSFASKALDIATNNPQFVPPYVDLGAMRGGCDLAVRLQGIEIQIASLREEVSDTNLAAGSQDFVTGLTLDNSINDAAKVTVPGTKALTTELGSASHRPPQPMPPSPDPTPRIIPAPITQGGWGFQTAPSQSRNPSPRLRNPPPHFRTPLVPPPNPVAAS